MCWFLVQITFKVKINVAGNYSKSTIETLEQGVKYVQN